MLAVVGVGKDERSGDGAVLERRGALFGSSLVIFGDEVNGFVIQRAGELVTAEFAGELAGFFFQVHAEEKRGSVKVRGDEPFAGDACAGSRRFLRDYCATRTEKPPDNDDKSCDSAHRHTSSTGFSRLTRRR